MRARNRERKVIAEINITPFTDVILVLLIIFMITTPLILQSNIKVNLPSSSSTESARNTPSQATVTVTNEGLIYLGNELVTRKELKDKVLIMYKSNPALEVVLFSDRKVQFSEIVRIFDVLSEVGVKNLNIAAKRDQG